MHFFGTDGIRGKSNEFPFDDKTLILIGYVFAKNLAKKSNSVLIGRDTRLSGKRILKSLQKGINAAGVKVVDLGIIPTAAVSYLLKHNNYAGGIVISASHNPYTDNGIKFFNSKGLKLADSVENKLEKELSKYINEKKEITFNNNIKNISGKNLIRQYENFLISLLPKNYLKNKKIVIDCANGSSYKIASKVLKTLKAEVIAVNNNPTGTNINLNCGALHPQCVGETVKKENAFCGFAFDGDADRVISSDDKGFVRDGDYFLAVTAKYMKEKNILKNNTVVITVMANLGLIKFMKESEINTVVSKVGDRYVYEDLKKHKAVLGGEQSGHIIFKNLLDTGDGIVSALELLKILVEKNTKLSKLCAQIKKYPQILINQKVAKKIPIANLINTTKYINDAQKKLGSNGRVLVRYSGTENLLRVMIEGRKISEIKRLAQNIAESAKKELAVM